MLKEGTLVAVKNMKTVTPNGQELFGEWVFAKVVAYDEENKQYALNITKGFNGRATGDVRIIKAADHEVHDIVLVHCFISMVVHKIAQSHDRIAALVSEAVKHYAEWVLGMNPKERVWYPIRSRNELKQFIFTLDTLAKARATRRERQMGMVMEWMKEQEEAKDFGNMVHELWTDYINKGKLETIEIKKGTYKINQCECGAPIYRASQDKRLLITL